jgi:hypothetical protein
MSVLTGSALIPCRDCKRTKKWLEKGGRLKVIACEPEPAQQSAAPDQQICRITWKVLGLPPQAGE